MDTFYVIGCNDGVSNFVYTKSMRHTVAAAKNALLEYRSIATMDDKLYILKVAEGVPPEIISSYYGMQEV